MAEKIETKEKKAPKEKKVGEVLHYFGKIGVAALKVKAEIKVGDTLHIKGHTTDLTQKADSIQIERKEIPSAKAGDDIGIKVTAHVRQDDKVYKVIP